MTIEKKFFINSYSIELPFYKMKEIIKKVRFLMSISINAFGESVKTKLTIFLRKTENQKKI